MRKFFFLALALASTGVFANDTYFCKSQNPTDYSFNVVISKDQKEVTLNTGSKIQAKLALVASTANTKLYEGNSNSGEADVKSEQDYTSGELEPYTLIITDEGFSMTLISYSSTWACDRK